MTKQIRLFPVCLTLHDAGAAAPGAAPAAAEAAPAGTELPDLGNRGKKGDAKPVVVYGKQAETKAPDAEGKPATPAQTPEERKAAYDKFMAEYKDVADADFQAKFQPIFDRRFKEAKTTQEKLDAYSPLVDLLGQKYGVQDGDPKKLIDALSKDDEFFEKMADKAGMPVDQFKKMLTLQMDNAQTKKQLSDVTAMQQRAQRNAQLDAQAKALKSKYANFDLATEIQSSTKFADLLDRGVDVKAAFEAVHFDEILSGAITVTGKQVEKTITSNIQAKGQRPTEGGAASPAGVIVKSDPSKFTAADRQEIKRRAERGEPIKF